MAGARPDGRGPGLVREHLRALNHALHSLEQVLESNDPWRVPGYHRLLLRIADPKHLDRLVHHHLSDLRGLPTISQPCVQHPAGSIVDEDRHCDYVCSRIHVSAWFFVKDATGTDVL